MAKKFLAVLFLVVSLLVSNTSVSYAARDLNGPWTPSTQSVEFDSYREAIEDDGCLTPSLECLVHQVFTFTALEFVNTTVFSEFKPSFSPGTGSGNDPEVSLEKSKVASQQKSGILAGFGTLIGNMYAYPAARTSTYIADVMNSAHITPRAYAQGLGFSSLNPILDLWKAFRNLAYMFFVIIFIIIGFMIMFRQRIGGQAAVTAQQAIPGIIISLVLVTFSYAIAGLLIDFMYLLMFLIVGIFNETLPGSLQNQSLIDMNIRQLTGVLFFSETGPISAETNIDIITNLFSSLLGTDVSGTAIGLIGGLSLTVILAIAVLFGTVKLFFELLKSYASIIVSVVTSPITLMMGAIPGKNPVVPWIKDLVGNLLPFPAVLFVLVLFFKFKSSLSGIGNEGGFMPPFLLGRSQAGSIASLLGLALILALPEIVKDVKKGLVKEGFGTLVFKAAIDAGKQGWKGGELIPGVAATNTNNLPYVGKYLGSGKSILRTAGVGGGLVLAPSVAAGVASGAGGTVFGAAGKATYGVTRRLNRRTRGLVPAFGWSSENPIISGWETGKKVKDVTSRLTGWKKKEEKKTP